MSMLDFAAIDTALEAWVRTLIGTDPSGTQVPVREASKPQKMTPHGVECIYEVTTVRRVGRDWTTYAEDVALADGEDFVPEQHGLRQLVVSIAVESTNASPGWSARHFLDRVRLRLRRPSSLEALRAAELSLVREDAITDDVRATVGERRLSKAVLDLTLSAYESEVDSAGATSWIEKGVLTTQIKRADGTLTPGNVTDLEIP